MRMIVPQDQKEHHVVNENQDGVDTTSTGLVMGTKILNRYYDQYNKDKNKRIEQSAIKFSINQFIYYAIQGGIMMKSSCWKIIKLCHQIRQHGGW